VRALITGGSKGIGRAVSEQVAQLGGEVLINYQHDADAAERAAAAVTAAGGRPVLLRGDACSLEGITGLLNDASEHVDGLDLVVHCAVVAYGGGALTGTESDFRASIEANGLSFLWLIRACAKLLTPGSSVIFLSSGGASRAVPNYAPLGMAKALAEASVRYLAAELAGRGVRVNAVSSAAVDTDALRAMMPDGVADDLLAASAERSPSGRALEPADVASAVVALAAPGTAMLQGQIVRVDGGLGLL
jgi:enoyl-[acyl-carrier protein] reductase III